MIEPAHPDLSLRRQCQLLGLNRSTWYYQPAGESAYNLQLMRLMPQAAATPSMSSIYARRSTAGPA